MIRGLYTAASGMLASQNQSNIIADNVANVQTPGYKEEQASAVEFSPLLIERFDSANGLPEAAPIGTMGTGVSISPTTKLNVQGALESTGKKTDLALNSPGYFVVQTANGLRYTRNGQFHLSSTGILQTADGNPVLGQNGPIGPLSQQFTVNSDGTVVDGGKTIDTLRIVNIPANALQRDGQSLYNATQTPQAAGNVQIRQGFIEASNVDMAGQMVQMINVMRTYEANQKVLQTEDSTLDKAVNEVGKI